MPMSGKSEIFIGHNYFSAELIILVIACDVSNSTVYAKYTCHIDIGKTAIIIFEHRIIVSGTALFVRCQRVCVSGRALFLEHT